ncbi:hypothetical protein CPB86DRAFT_104448 [Serendipita vermifera]|nr:hypothetical protein CPB86DRAFT_104448 [Serendipita vermifera]
MATGVQLPAELWIAIIHFVDERRDLYHLCRTSKLFRSIAGPKLYEQHFRCSEQAKSMDIRSLLRHPMFGLFINTLRLQLESCLIYPRQYSYELTWEVLCPCDEIDNSLAIALQDLLNLKTLNLLCSFCNARSYKRHRYLASLQTKMLQEVRFSCVCSDIDEERLVEYFGAPCMASLITLGWYSRVRVSTSGQFGTSLSNSSMLPNLRNLYYHTGGLSDLLLRYRPIQRISSLAAPPYSFLKCEDLVKKRDVLTHISVQDEAVTNTLFTIIADDPLPFRNLQHLGAFWLNSSTCLDRCNELCTVLSTLTALKCLVSVEGRYKVQFCIKCFTHIQPFCSGLGILRDLFPNLVRVFLMRVEWGRSLWDIWRFSNNWYLEMQDHQMDGVMMIQDWPA